MGEVTISARFDAQREDAAPFTIARQRGEHLSRQQSTNVGVAQSRAMRDPISRSAVYRSALIISFGVAAISVTRLSRPDNANVM